MTIRKIFIALGFAALFPFIVFQAARSIAPPPGYSDPSAADETSVPGESAAAAEARTERNRARREAAEALSNARQVDSERTHVFVAAGAGLVAILAGAWLAIDSLGAGLILGAVIGIVYAVSGTIVDKAVLPRAVAITVGLAGLILAARRLEKGAGGRASDRDRPGA